MKNYIVLLFWITLLFSCEKDVSDIRGNNFTDAEILEKLESHFEKLDTDNRFDGAVLAAKDGNPIYEQSFGHSSEGILNSNDAPFNIASIGKMFTGVAIMQLVQSGYISLDDNIRKYLPNYGNEQDAKRITIEHLLTHRSGIPDIFSSELINTIDHESIEKASDYFPYFEFSKLEFKPGKKFSYSNSGYLVLGAILEAVSGQIYCDYLQDNIFERSEMTELECAMAMGGSMATPQEMFQFTEALLRHQLLNEFHTELVMTGVGRLKQSDKMYAYGFEIEQNKYGKEIFHKGGDEGIKAYLAMYPESRYTLIFYANNKENGFDGFLESIEFLKSLFW